MLTAAKDGDKTRVECLLKYNETDINYSLISDLGYSPLMHAAIKGHSDAVKLLIADDKIDVNKEASSTLTALMLASCVEANFDVVTILLGNTLVEINKRDKDSCTALCHASTCGNSDTVKQLIEHPLIDVNRGDYTPLYRATEAGNSKVVKLLLSHQQIDVNKISPNGWTAISRATEDGHSDIVEQLLGHPKINALHWASDWGYYDQVKALVNDTRTDVNKRDDNGATALCIASQRGHYKIVQLLLGHPNIDVNIGDVVGETPLYKATSNAHSDTIKLLIGHNNIDINKGKTTDGQTPLTIASKMGNFKQVKLLMSEPTKLDINKVRASDGATALWIASFRGHSEVVNSLLNSPDTDVNKCTINRETPLMVASAGGYSSIVRTILAHAKTDVNFVTFEGKTAFWYIIDGSNLLSKSLHTIMIFPNATIEKQKEIIELILRCPSTDMLLMDEGFMTAKKFAISKNRTDIIKAIESRNVLLGEGHTCCSNKVNDGLQKAAEVGDLRMVESFLLCSQVDINIGYKYGLTPLFVASKNNHYNVVRALLSDARTDVNVVVNSGNALLAASESGHTEVVALLLKHTGIDANMVNTRNMKTALIVASDEGHRDIVELLLRHTQIDVNKIDSFGETALEKASWKSYLRVVKLFLRCSETDVSKEYINQLKESGKKEVVEVIRWWGTLLQTRATCCLNVDKDLLKAATNGHFRSIRGLLLCPKSDINIVNKRGRTALFQSSLKGHIQAVEVLLAHHLIDINKGEIFHEGTAFSIASEKGHFDIMRKLIHQDETDINLGWTADKWTTHIFNTNPTSSSTEWTQEPTIPGIGSIVNAFTEWWT